MTLIRPPHTRTTMVTLFLSVLFITGCASTKVSETPPSNVDLSGTWVLNQPLSADTQGAIAYAMAEARQARSDAGGRSGGMRGGKGGGTRGSGMGGGGPGGSGGRGGSRNNGQERALTERLDQIVAELSPSTDKLTIRQSATDLTVLYGTQWEYRHQFGEETTVHVAGVTGERVSGWQEHQYVVETKTENRSTVTERFTVAPDGSQLQIALTLESKRLSDPIIVTRVFDRAPESESTAASKQ